MDENTAAPATLSARIAALNMGQVGRSPNDRSPQQAPASGPEPTRTPTESTRRTSNTRPVPKTRSTTARHIGNQPLCTTSDGILPPPTLGGMKSGVSEAQKPPPLPQLPPRRASVQPSPALPPRRPSERLATRRDSIESTSSAISNISSRSTQSNGTTLTSSNSRSPSFEASSARVKAPAYDPSNLPALPPKRSQQEKEQAREQAMAPQRPARPSAGKGPSEQTPRIRPKEPPRLPTRRSESTASLELPGRVPRDDSPAAPKRSALSLGMNQETEQPPSLPARRPTNQSHPSTHDPAESSPPPVPLASRPTKSQLEAAKSQATKGVTGSCLKCRDFSAPDYHASRFPRQSLPSTSIDWLAQNLTGDFPSHTDKARVIFTWLHHNIEYDVQNFFAGTLGPSTPQSTLSSGLAVCQGYGELFRELATKSGLECFVISGHGKGYGFTTLAPGSPIPEYKPSGHAWNAVKIDGGEWKLIDPCWGAGSVGGPGKPYTKRFAPCFFTMDNVEFGLRHFPRNKDHFFRHDGRVPSWEEYIIGDASGEPPQVYTGAQDNHGLSETGFLPRYKKINVSDPLGPIVRFQCEKMCQHWDGVKAGKGKPYVFILTLKNVHGAGGKGDYVPFETNGHFWWVDVPVEQLGKAGDKVSLYAVTTVQGNDGRGLSVDEYRAAKGKKAMGFGGIACWELI
ncbi:MAG: hypothetical protein M1837_001645 [Sclerophora amabilis]|nr:MAG: hypothetical protein M1837_001645 [Sclerophora amabilis]